MRVIITMSKNQREESPLLVLRIKTYGCETNYCSLYIYKYIKTIYWEKHVPRVWKLIQFKKILTNIISSFSVMCAFENATPEKVKVKSMWMQWIKAMLLSLNSQVSDGSDLHCDFHVMTACKPCVYRCSCPPSNLTSCSLFSFITTVQCNRESDSKKFYTYKRNWKFMHCYYTVVVMREEHETTCHTVIPRHTVSRSQSLDVITVGFLSV